MATNRPLGHKKTNPIQSQSLGNVKVKSKKAKMGRMGNLFAHADNCLKKQTQFALRQNEHKCI